MNIDRNIKQGNIDLALNRLNFCLKMFEEDESKIETIFAMRPIKNCTIEEMIDAMISAEQILKDVKNNEGIVIEFADFEKEYQTYSDTSKLDKIKLKEDKNGS